MQGVIKSYDPGSGDGVVLRQQHYTVASFTSSNASR